MNQGVQGTKRDHSLISESKCSRGRQLIGHQCTQEATATRQCHTGEAPAGQN